MTCASCGVRNVDFASTCFSCRQPLGKLSAVTAPRFHVKPSRPANQRRPAMTRSGAGAPRVPRGAIMPLLLVAAVAWVVARGLPLRMRSVSPHRPTRPRSQRRRFARSRSPSPLRGSPRLPSPEEQNGFRLSHFEWGAPAAGPGSSFRAGETVSGRSEIQGFGVTADARST